MKDVNEYWSRGEIMDNIIEVQFNEMLQRTRSIWQYDYGQVLKILSGGVVLPNFLEVHFSLSRNNKECITRIGTTVNGVTEVQIPNELLNTENKTHDYFIYAFIYVSTEKYGNTKCEIIIPVKSRIKPENPSEEPLPEPNIFHETVEAVNAAADRAKMAEQNAKESATEAGKHAASASESAVTAEKTKEDALRKVGEKKQEAIEAIQNQEETSVGNLTTHTDGEIQRIQNQTAESKGELEQTIINAGVSEEELDESIQTASDTKTALDKSVELARTAKTELDTSTQKAGEAKTALDGSAKTAGEMQETLSATVKQAGALDTSLGEKIKTGTQLKTDLTASGEKAVQDIQTAGSEQLGKMQAVAEEFTADREQIANNKEDIGSLKEDLSNKITKFYASNQGETHLADSDNGKIMDMMLYGRSEQKQYKGINLLPPNIKYSEFIEVSIPKETKVFAITDGTKFSGGNFLFFNADKTKREWFGLDKDTTISTRTLTIDAKYVQNLLDPGLDVSKICLGIGSEPIYEPYVGGKPSPSPDYPQEIKRVVNPTMKVCGKNLWDNFKTLSLGNVEQKNGTYIATADTMQVDITSSSIGARPLLLKANNAYTFSLKTTVSISSPKFVCLRYTNGESNNIIFTNKNFVNFVPERDVEKIGFILYESVAGDKAYDVQLEMGSEATAYEPYTEQSVQLPYTLNAIPVASGGNVTINGQQYIADYVDVERGKVVRMCERKKLNTKNGVINEEYRLAFDIAPYSRIGNDQCIFSAFEWTAWTTCAVGSMVYIKNIQKPNDELYTAQELKELSIDFDVIYQLLEQQETDLTPEQTQALKELVTYYPVTNISVNSEQLDGYTVFNYPISMKNGWDYVKKQLNDNRDYIYDMDAKTQDIDTQSAEAYVNSEYAVALTELEV